MVTVTVKLSPGFPAFEDGETAMVLDCAYAIPGISAIIDSIASSGEMIFSFKAIDIHAVLD